MASYIKKFFYGEETDQEKLYKFTLEFMSDKKLLTAKVFNEAMGTTMLDNGLTPVDNYMESILNSGGCFAEKNFLRRLVEEFKKNYAETNYLVDYLLKIQEENIALEKEIDAYKKIISRCNNLNGNSIFSGLFPGRNPNQAF